MEKLFLLKPGFQKENHPNLYYCPDCAIIEGVLQYYPQIRYSTEVVYVDYLKPRIRIVELIGEENQSSPVLITLSEPAFEFLTLFKKHGSCYFLDTPDLIMEYFSLKYSLAFTAKPYDQSICSI
jgi:hypothetical protein